MLAFLFDCVSGLLTSPSLMLDMRWKLTRLDDVGADIFETGFNLLSNKV